MGSRPRKLPLQCLIEKSEDGFLEEETDRKRCSEKGTGVRFEEIEQMVIIKSEKLRNEQGTLLTEVEGYKVCDHIVFIKGEREYTLLIELCKGSSKSHDEIIQQLSHGGEESLRLLSACSHPPDLCHFGFFYIYTSVRSSSFFKVLQGKRIRFRGKNYPVLPMQARNHGFFVVTPDVLESELIPRKKR